METEVHRDSKKPRACRTSDVGQERISLNRHTRLERATTLSAEKAVLHKVGTSLAHVVAIVCSAIRHR